MLTLQEKYGCEFAFTTKKNSGSEILRLLGVAETVWEIYGFIESGWYRVSNNANIVIAQSLMMRIKYYTERALNERDVTLDVAMAEIRHTVDAYDEHFHTGRKSK